jgi:hypothetical protein
VSSYSVTVSLGCLLPPLLLALNRPHLPCRALPPPSSALRSAVELVSLLAPSFVTLEEVPGFLAQK